MATMATADDLRIFLALAHTGRIVHAATRLGIDHTTVSRRISRLEREMGQRLFDRSSDGWSLTHEGKLLLVPAEAVEDAVREWQDLIGTSKGGLKGTVRLVCPDALGMYLVAPALREITAENDGITVELYTTTQKIDDRLREFDVIVTVERPAPSRGTSWHLSEYRVGFYASETYLSRAQPIRTRGDLRAHTHIGFVDRMIDFDALRDLQHVLPRAPRIQCASVGLQIEAIAGGAGIGTLPVFMEPIDSRLVRVLPDVEFRRDYWITVSNTAQRLRRIQKVVKLLTNLVDENRATLSGPGASPTRETLRPSRP